MVISKLLEKPLVVTCNGQAPHPVECSGFGCFVLYKSRIKHLSHKLSRLENKSRPLILNSECLRLFRYRATMRHRTSPVRRLTTGFRLSSVVQNSTAVNILDLMTPTKVTTVENGKKPVYQNKATYSIPTEVKRFFLCLVWFPVSLY